MGGMGSVSIFFPSNGPSPLTQCKFDVDGNRDGDGMRKQTFKLSQI